MKRLQRNERILIIAAAILLLSVLLMIIILPGILKDTSPGSNPKMAGTAIGAAILIRLIILLGYIKVIKESRRPGKKRKGEYLGLGILILVLGLVYLDGAFAFFDHILFVSILMFASVLCDLVTSLLTIVVYFLKPQPLQPTAKK